MHGGICQTVHVMPGRPQVVVLRCSAWPKTAQDAPQRGSIILRAWSLSGEFVTAGHGSRKQ